MTSTWHDFLGAAGARIERQLVSDFGDATSELASAATATVVAPLTHLAIIDVGGADGAAFLHNQFTSDVNHLPSDRAQHSAWCSAKGRMLASFLVFRQDASLHLRLAAESAAAITRRLQMYVLRSRVTVSDRSVNRAIVGLAGPQALAALQAADLPQPVAALGTAAFADGVVIRLDERRFEIVVDVDAAPALWDRLRGHARPVGTPAWQWLDIEAGIPLIGERTRELFVPQMAGFERLGGISFNKGCYPGQEVVARTQYLGKVKRHLYRVRLSGPAEAGDVLSSPASPESVCGTLVNTAPAPGGGYAALAVIQEAFAAGDLRLGAPDGVQVTVTALSG